MNTINKFIYLKKVQYEANRLRIKQFPFDEAIVKSQNSAFQSLKGLRYRDYIHKKWINIYDVEVTPIDNISYSRFRSFRMSGVFKEWLYDFFREEPWKIVCLVDKDKMIYEDFSRVVYYLNLQNTNSFLFNV